MKRGSFIQNAVILTATALILRSVGMFFRIYISNKIGAEGMGLYQLIFSIYILATTVATTGISTAVTRLIAEQIGCGTKKNIQRIFRRSVMISLAAATVSGLALFLGADFIAAHWIGDLRAAPALRILAPSLPFMGAASCLRGYFIARRRVANPSNAQIFEQIVRIGLVMLILENYSPQNITEASIAVVLGNTVSEIACCLYMAVGHRRDQRKFTLPPNGKAQPLHGVTKKLLAIAVPITSGRLLNTILRTIENILVPNRLEMHNHSKETSLSEFGMLKGMAMPILFFPSSFLSAFSTLLVPEISQASAMQQKHVIEGSIDRTIRITTLFSILIAGIFALFAMPLGEMVYQSAEVGQMIRILSVIVPFMYLESIADGILKGLNQQLSSFWYSMIDSSSRICAILIFLPMWGMYGFLGIMIVSNILTCTLNVRRLLIVTGMRMQWLNWVIKPLLALGLTCLGVLLIQGYLSNLQQILYIGLGIVLCSIIYFSLLYGWGCIRREDIQHFIRKKKTNPIR